VPTLEKVATGATAICSVLSFIETTGVLMTYLGFLDDVDGSVVVHDSAEIVKGRERTEVEGIWQLACLLPIPVLNIDFLPRWSSVVGRVYDALCPEGAVGGIQPDCTNLMVSGTPLAMSSLRGLFQDGREIKFDRLEAQHVKARV
jgi:hypothetical protein